MKKLFLTLILVVLGTTTITFAQGFQQLVDSSITVEGNTLIVSGKILTDCAIFAKNYGMDSTAVKEAFTQKFFSLPNFESVILMGNNATTSQASKEHNDLFVKKILSHINNNSKTTLEKRLGMEVMHYLVLPRTDYK